MKTVTSVHLRWRKLNIMLYSTISFLVRSLKGEESLYKLNNSRIQIRIVTKIESIRLCDTPNVSTKFRPNPSTTFWDSMLYISLALSPNGEESLKKIIGSESGFSPKLNQFFLVKDPTCPPSFVQIHPKLFEISCYISFWPDLSMVKNHLKNSISWIQIRIFPKI